MPEVENATTTRSQVARAVHNISPPLTQGLEHSEIVSRVVFGIGILYTHKITTCVLEAGSQSRALALIVCMFYKSYFRMNYR